MSILSRWWKRSAGPAPSEGGTKFDVQANDLVNELLSFMPVGGSSLTIARAKRFRRLSPTKKKVELPGLYLLLEQEITKIGSTEKASWTQGHLREHVRIKYGALQMLFEFSLIFENLDGQELSLGKMFLKYVFDDVAEIVGPAKWQLPDVTEWLESLPKIDRPFRFFDLTNDLKVLEMTRTKAWIELLAFVSHSVFALIGKDLGERRIRNIYQSAYIKLSTIYGALEGLTVLIKLLPDSLIDETKIDQMNEKQLRHALFLKIDSLRVTTERLQSQNEKLVQAEVSISLAYQASEEQANRLSVILDTAGEGIVTFDENGTIRLANRQVQEVWGYSSNSLLGRHFTDLFAENESSKLEDKLFSSEKQSLFLHQWTEVDARRADGIKFPAEVYFSKGTVYNDFFFAMAIRDVSEKKRNEALIANQQQSLLVSSKLSALGEMAGGIAHEINTPLAAISLSSSQLQELLEENPLNLEDIAHLSKTIESMSAKIARIVSGMRLISRDAARDPFVLSKMSEIILGTVALCEEKFKNSEVSLKIDIAEEGLYLQCRAAQISQVLLNLLSNARDAVVSRESPWVHLTCQEVETDIELRVIDCGEGLSPNVVSKLFQPFFTTKDIGKGTGLGLSISRSITLAHGGQIFVDEKCANTCFVVRLPKRQN